MAHAATNDAGSGEHKKKWFSTFAQATSSWTGSPSAFVLAFGIIVVWAVTGPVFHYSDTWQLVINTGTTIVTFLMVFLIQNSQNRDAKVIQLKLDELIRAVETAETSLINMDEMSEEELKEVQQEFTRVAAEAKEEIEDIHEKRPRKGATPRKAPAKRVIRS
ncbi:low affinity iron permease family protein [Asticcacaulis solisilvae]|uniref:low affinity iron permease family protein n=1 Tax=Asticcacaulis solisilvae TaxID=1217274 RepID=UPI003FD74B7A